MANAPNRAKPGFSVSLERGLAVLSTFAAEGRMLGIGDLARLLDLNPSTVHRYVRTLTTLGYLQQDSATRKYRLGFKVADLGLAVINSLDATDVARPHLSELRDRWNLTANMGILDGAEIVYVQRIVGRRSMDLPLHVGSRQPAHCNSMGKALLASLDEVSLAEIIRLIDFSPRGPRSLNDPDALRDELRRVRSRGYAVNNEELAAGERSVAAPVRNVRGDVIAAVNLHASPYTYTEIIEVLAPAIVETANLITEELGGQAARTVQASSTR